jgi:hypothetical protein
MEARPSLDEQRATWKGLVAEDLEAALESIWSVVKGHSSRTDGILAMLGQYRQLEADNQKGILRYEEWLLQVNRLRHQLLDWLDDLSGEDLGWETAELQTPLQVASDNESPLAQLQILDEEHGRVLAFFPQSQPIGSATTHSGGSARPPKCTLSPNPTRGTSRFSGVLSGAISFA